MEGLERSINQAALVTNTKPQARLEGGYYMYLCVVSSRPWIGVACPQAADLLALQVTDSGGQVLWVRKYILEQSCATPGQS